MIAEKPVIDFGRIDFPSDHLTIKALRADNPLGFEQEEPRFFADAPWGARSDLSITLWMERALAHKAFADALGLEDPHPDPDWSRRELVRNLADNYEDYGLTSGLRHTEQMAREIEKQAVAQAREISGKQR